MRFELIVVGVALSIVPPASAQQTTPAEVDPCSVHARASFDVATVKPSDSSPDSASMHSRRDSIRATMTVRSLVENAYGLRHFQVVGGPGWVDNASWEVQAKIDPPEQPSTSDAEGKAQNERSRQRLQSLLEGRFQLKCHMETRQLPVYELDLAKGSGSKLTETTAPKEKQQSISSNGNGRKVDFTATGITMEEAATAFSDEVGRKVVDKTGFSGRYDLRLTWMPAMASTADADAASGPSIFTALEEQAGLKLVPAKGPVQVLVIDSVEKPSEN